MTLVVMAHDLERNAFGFSGNSQLQSRGVFFVADSAITSPSSNGRKTLLGGFRKIYDVPVKLWRPYFVGEYFRGYQRVHEEINCAIAFAGSTLVAQHVLNLIVENLSNLRISIADRYSHGRPEYVVLRHRQENPLLINPGANRWGDDMFLESDVRGLLSANVIVKTVSYSIGEALSSARQYRLSEQELNEMKTEFALSIFCPVKRKHEAHVFRFGTKLDDDGIYEIDVTHHELDFDEVAVLGLRKFEQGAQFLHELALSNSRSSSSDIFDYVEGAIDCVTTGGSGEIDRPAYLMRYHQGRLSLIREVA